MAGCIIETHLIGANPALAACTQRVSGRGRLMSDAEVHLTLFFLMKPVEYCKFSPSAVCFLSLVATEFQNQYAFIFVP